MNNADVAPCSACETYVSEIRVTVILMGVIFLRNVDFHNSYAAPHLHYS
jgi:hypothetical protein